MNNAQTLQMLRDASDRQILRPAPSPLQADIYLAEADGRRFIIKDFSRRAWPLRVCGARPMLRHEYRVLRELLEIPGIPRVYGLLGADALAMEFIAGCGTLRSHKELSPEQYPPLEFFRQLGRIVESMHAHGVAHGDIRRRNILITENGPALIDFGTGIRCRGRCRAVRLRLFRIAARIDRRKALKLRALYYPQSITAAERDVLRHKPWWLRIGQAARKYLYRQLLKPKTWRWRFYRWSRILPRPLRLAPPRSVYENCDNQSEEGSGP